MKYYLCSGYMLNCAFGTNHCPPEQLYIMTPAGFEKLEDFMETNNYENTNTI